MANNKFKESEMDLDSSERSMMTNRMMIPEVNTVFNKPDPGSDGELRSEFDYSIMQDYFIECQVMILSESKASLNCATLLFDDLDIKYDLFTSKFDALQAIIYKFSSMYAYQSQIIEKSPVMYKLLFFDIQTDEQLTKAREFASIVHE